MCVVTLSRRMSPPCSLAGWLNFCSLVGRSFCSLACSLARCLARRSFASTSATPFQRLAKQPTGEPVIPLPPPARLPACQGANAERRSESDTHWFASSVSLSQSSLTLLTDYFAGPLGVSLRERIPCLLVGSPCSESTESFDIRLRYRSLRRSASFR